MDEKITILQLRELLDIICNKLSDIKRRIVSKELKGNIYLPYAPYASHFYIDPRLEPFIKTLELNYFISKYDELSDKDGAPSFIYCVNFGLAKSKNLVWGKPSGTKYRKYFIERPFNFNKFVKDYLASSKSIHCINPKCKNTFTVDQLPFIEFNKNKCNICGYPVLIEPVSDSIIDTISKIGEEKLLPQEEIKIIFELQKSYPEYKHAKEIAEELDYSSSLVAWRSKNLDEKESLVERKVDTKPYKYRLTKKALDRYFNV